MNKCDIALVQRKKNMFYIHDFQSYVFNYDLLYKGYIFNMTLLDQQLQKILQEFRGISRYIALSISGELLQESLERFKKNNTLYSTHVPANQNKYYIDIERSQLLQYQLLFFKLNKPCIVLTSQLSCLLHLARYSGVQAGECDSVASLHTSLKETLLSVTSRLIISSHECDASMKMVFAGLYLMSTSDRS